MRTLLLSSCVVLSLCLTSLPVPALEPLVLYDDFSAKLIDPDKWFGGGGGFLCEEAIRQTQGGRLRLLCRSYGKTDSDTGTSGCSLTLNFSKPAVVTAIAATIQVKKVQAAGCAIPGSAVADIRALLHGSFFNAGTPTPGSSVNDVRATLRLDRASSSTDPPNVLRVQARAFQCTNDTCSTSTSLGFKDLGPVTSGDIVKLRLQWHSDNNRFIFQRDVQPEVFLSYSVPDTAPPSNQFKYLGVLKDVPNCTATPRPVGFMDAFFDDVMVNQSAATAEDD